MAGFGELRERERKLQGDDEYERERRKHTILGGMLNPGELTLDPEIAREPELAGLSAPRADVRLGGMDEDSDRLAKVLKSINRARGFRWNPDSPEGARNLAAEHQAAIKSVYGESPLKQENTRSQIAAREAAIGDRRAGMQQRATAAAERAKIMRERLERDRAMDPVKKRELLARVAAFEGRGAADRARAAEIEERLPWVEDKALYELDRLESEIGKNEASTALSRKRAEKLERELPYVTRKAEAQLERWANDEQHKQNAEDLRYWLAQLRYAEFGSDEHARAFDNVKKLAELTLKGTPDTAGIFSEATGKTEARKVRGAGAAALAGSPGTPRVSEPPQPRVSGGAKLPIEKPGKDTSPAAKPSGDTTTAQTPQSVPGNTTQKAPSGALAEIQRIAATAGHKDQARAKAWLDGRSRKGGDRS